MITITADGAPVELGTLRFSGGELQPRIKGPFGPTREVEVTAHVWGAEELVELALVANAVDHAFPGATTRLVLPYLPYARQDRVCYPGEAFSLQVVSAMINYMGFSEVEVWDVHSQVPWSLVANLVNRPPSALIDRLDLASDRLVVVAPDAGARDRALGVAEKLHARFAQATKHRDPDTGFLSGASIDADAVLGADCLMVDDICDGGRTFVNLARVLREAGARRVELYVTHGIFSAGLDPLRGAIDCVYCPNIHPAVAPDPFLVRL